MYNCIYERYMHNQGSSVHPTTQESSNVTVFSYLPCLWCLGWWCEKVYIGTWIHKFTLIFKTWVKLHFSLFCVKWNQYGAPNCFRTFSSSLSLARFIRKKKSTFHTFSIPKSKVCSEGMTREQAVYLRNNIQSECVLRGNFGLTKRRDKNMRLVTNLCRNRL